MILNLIRISLIIFLSFSTSRCRSQQLNQKNRQIVKIEFLKDSIFCKKLDAYTTIDFIKIDHINKKIKDKINGAILSKNTNKNEQPFITLYSHFMDSLAVSCNEIDEELSLFQFGGDYQITYNENDILSVIGVVRDNLYQKFSENLYCNFNIETGDLLRNREVFNSDTLGLISKINHKIHTDIKDHTILNIVEDSELNKDDKEFYISDLNNFLTEKKYVQKKIPVWVLKKSESFHNSGINFTIQFRVFSEMLNALNPSPNLFFSFEELKPYLTDDFKKQIGLK